jgi:transcriptional regulator with XRE-family HTH domain
MSDERTFGQRLRENRIRSGFSQSDLEEISGIPKARLSRYENGHVAPSIQTLERLARALQVSEASLLGDGACGSRRASRRRRSATRSPTSPARWAWWTSPPPSPPVAEAASRH